MRHNQDFAAETRIVTAEELAQLASPAPALPEHSDFELPRWMWSVMLGGYGTFLGGLLGATAGEGRAEFAVAISAFYVAMFFGTARVLANVDDRRVGVFGRTGGKLNTWTGPMDTRSVAGQVLVLPVLLGFFGVAIAIISAIVA
ncbi:hypothetical protein [Tsuneonella amylolytica]|uniref:hypothetical protein n=1 Tax=Tsuneonella amylolytica TaxID=2338327 RepID=UPI000EA8C5C3|nr:hypothetical protein [Tsuneonella amylolytica]